jgi:acetolactate synthase-1/2/3 large subunit
MRDKTKAANSGSSGPTGPNGGELAVRTLRMIGVDTLFALHGAHIDTIFQACAHNGLAIIDTRHEAAAGHAAEGYARVTHRLGVALVTAGGGFTNVLTSMANAFFDRTPLLYITGSGCISDDETNALQAGIDQVAMATPVTKWAHRVLVTDHIPRLIRQAARTALASPRGPVLLDIPWDVLTGIGTDGDALAPADRACETVIGPLPPGEALHEIVAALGSAGQPAIILGSDASRADPSLLASLAAATGAPVFAEFEALGVLAALPDNLRGGLVQGMHGLFGATGGPDVILLAGARFGLHTGFASARLLPEGARIIQIDADAREIARLRPVEQGFIADPSATLDALGALGGVELRSPNNQWRAAVLDHVATRYSRVDARANPSERLHPFRAAQVIERHIAPNTTIVADGALTYLWLSEVVSRRRPAAFLCHGYLGSMGVGFGVALGAAVAGRGTARRTILITGDGAIGYALAEFDTAVRHALPLIVIVMNNRSWGATLHFQQHAAGPDRITGTRLENGDYHAVAAALGAEGWLASTEANFEAALATALASSHPSCINVLVELDPIPPEEMAIMGLDPF